MPGPSKALLASAACLLFGITAGWTVNGWRWEAKRAAELQSAIDGRQKAEQAANLKSAELEDALLKQRQLARDLNRRLAHEAAKPDYACPVPVTGMQLLRDAVAGHTTGKPHRRVP